MSETDDTGRAKETEALRWASNFLCEWRVCANASCRRARSCRGRPYLCGKRNSGALPKGVRDFFTAVLAAKLVGLPFEDFSSPGARRPMPRPDDLPSRSPLPPSAAAAPLPRRLDRRAKEHPGDAARRRGVAPRSFGRSSSAKRGSATKEPALWRKRQYAHFLPPRPREGERRARFRFKLHT